MTEPCQHPENSGEVLFSATDYVTGEVFRLSRCTACGLVRTFPTPDRLDAYYPQGYYGVGSERPVPAWVEWTQRLLYDRRARKIERLSVGPVDGRRRRILDIGCGRGLLLRAFQQRGWEVQGTELSDQAARHARERLRIPVNVGLESELPWPDGHFDAVTLWHVLEHVCDPLAVLREASRVLRTGGVFLVGTPNFASLESRLTRDKWFHLDVPRHLSHFTPATLHAAVDAVGMEPRVTSFLAAEYDLFSFIQSALNTLQLRHNLLYEMLRGKRGRLTHSSKPAIVQSCLSLLLAIPLAVVGLPAVAIAAGLHSGATFTIIGTRRGTEPRQALRGK